MTGRIPHRQQHRLVLALRRRERRLAPRIPIDGIVRVLQQVRAGFGGEAIALHLTPPASVRMRATITEDHPMSESSLAAQLPALRLKRNEDRRLHAGHLWVFSNEVDTQQTPLPKFQPGELVRVLAHNDRALGLAYVNPHSLISARLLSSWKMPDQAWFAARIRVALGAARAAVSGPYYRLVYGESDGLPGLVVDRYGSHCVVQIGTAGMERLKPQIQAALQQVLKCDALLFKNDGSTREMEGLPSYVEVALGSLR